MDQIETINELRLCCQELQELNEKHESAPVEILYTEKVIAKKMLEIAQNLDVSDFIPKKVHTSKVPKLHNHPGMERKLEVDFDHVVIDADLFNLLWDHWGQIEKLFEGE